MIGQTEISEVGRSAPCFVCVELARSARIELDVVLVAPLVDVGGGVELIWPDLVSHRELGVGDGRPDPLLLRHGCVD